MVTSRHLALIALGSNQKSDWGDARATVLKAMVLVGKLSNGPVSHSDLFRTPAYPDQSGPAFVNAAMAIATACAPEALLTDLHNIEAQAGRTRDQRWGSRSLDLDLICLGDQILPDPQTQTWWRDLPLAVQQQEAPTQIIVPHPRIQDRSFVLVPLAQIAPDWLHPGLQLTVLQMLARRPAQERDSVVVMD